MNIKIKLTATINTTEKSTTTNDPSEISPSTNNAQKHRTRNNYTIAF